MDNPKKVIVRFPPSPTGNLHIGSARTALFNYLFARKYEGKVYLRIEDTDTARSKKEFEENILESLKWLGLSLDTPPSIAEGALWRQSERGSVYESHLKRLIDNGTAYISKETPSTQNDTSKAEKRGEVIRFKNPGTIITFDDIVRGPITFDTKELGDFVIAKSPTEPLYHLAVVIDDGEMGVTHVIRGEDHISNTPRQILLLQALGFNEPTYAHIPLILAPDRSKLSKRHGAISVTEYRERGFLPQSIVNYLALLGWNPGDEREFFSTDELISNFDLGRVQKGGAIFNEEKLRSMNHAYLKTTGIGLSATKTKISKLFPDAPTETIDKVSPIISERLTTLKDLDIVIDAGEIDYFFKLPEYDSDLLLWKGTEPKTDAVKHLSKILELVNKISSWDSITIKNTLFPYAEEAGKGSVLWPLRVALSGREKSTDPFSIASIIGKEDTEKRIANAINKLS